MKHELPDQYHCELARMTAPTPTPTSLRIGEAKASDAPEISAIFSASLHSLDFMPQLYSTQEEAWFIANVILKECRVVLAEEAGEALGFLALQDCEVRLLYVHPKAFARGIGSALLAWARKNAPEELWLWCFEANAKARQFYEKQGFHIAERSDGARNEEKLPDLKYIWKRQ